MCSIIGYFLLANTGVIIDDILSIVLSQAFFGISAAINPLVTMEYVLDLAGKDSTKIAILLQLSEILMAFVVPFYILLS